MPTTLHCPSCSAPGPITAADTQPCLFCGADVPVPPEISVPVGRSAELQAQLAGWNKTATEYRGHHRFYKNFLWFMVGVPVVTVGGVGAMFVQDVVIPALATPLKAVVIVGGLICGAAFILAPLVTSGVAYLRRRRHSTPFAVVTVTDTIRAQCSGCGEGLVADGGITAQCRRCGIVSLLPAPMVSQRLANQHARVVAAREEGLEAVSGYETAMQRANVAAGRAWQWLAVVYVVAIPALCILAKLSGELKQGWPEVLFITALSTGMSVGLSWGSGWLAIRSAGVKSST